MSELVIGADGFIGSRLVEMCACVGTSRRPGTKHLHFDMSVPRAILIPADIVYVCAGANGAKRCEGNQDAFRVNVDAPIEIANEVAKAKGFMVWISSMSVEWLDGAYQRQKLAAEMVLRSMPHVGVVRAGRVTRDNRDDLCELLVAVGRNKVSGLTRWGTDEIAYAK
jgi:nucleoside-diphosphate-sugar epimerase